MGSDSASKLAASFTRVGGKIVAYDSSLRKYTVRADNPVLPLIECPPADYGVETPFNPGDDVVLERIPNRGWVVCYRIPVTRNVRARAPGQLPDEQLTELDEVSYQDPNNDEPLFHARPGDSVVRRERAKFVVSRAGIIAAKVKDTCFTVYSAALSVVKTVAFDWVLAIPRITFRAFLDRVDEQPKIRGEVRPLNQANVMKFFAGGLSADGVDGIDVILGNNARLLFQMLPATQRLFYQQGNTTIESTVEEFLLQFGAGTYSMTDAGIQVALGTSVISVTSDALELLASDLTINAPVMTAQVGTMTVDANVLVLQQFHWLTVVQRLNSLLLAFSTHTHQVGPIPSSTPIGNPVNEKGTPIGTPVIVGEPPVSP